MTLGAVASSRLKQKAISLGGTDEYVSFGNQTEYQFERTNAHSFSFWIKTTSGAFGVPYSKITNGAPFRGYDCYMSTTGKIGCSWVNNDVAAGVQVETTTAPPVNDGAWHHVAITYSGSSTAAGVHIWVDGTDRALTTLNDALSATIANSVVLAFGARPASPGLLFPWVGQFADFMVLSKELSSGEVAELRDFTRRGVPSTVAGLSFAANVVGFWRPSLGDSHPTIDDLSTANHNGTMTNTEAADIVTR
jgi:hypothetical protein